MLLAHPDVAQAVAFGVPDEKYGEEVRNLKPCRKTIIMVVMLNYLSYCCLTFLSVSSKCR